MTSSEIIIIGAGAAGLMAARELGALGKTITILEARDRIGGRIQTLEKEGFSRYVETGAEFVHGKLPVTFGILKEAGIEYISLKGELWRKRKGELVQEEDFVEGADLFSKKLEQLKQDMTVRAFLETYFPGEKYENLRSSVKGFVEGYDAADMNRASAFALREEWSANDDWEQFRIKGGYGKLIAYLENQCRLSGCMINLSQTVKAINWSENNVEIVCAEGTVYKARKLVVTVPLGVLQSHPETISGIRFSPGIDEKLASIREIGFGSVIKFLLQFNSAFWEHAIPGKKLKKMGFLFSDSKIPTWWTQFPDNIPLLTGWLGGPGTDRFKDADNEILLNEALTTLESVFRMKKNELSTLLTASHIVNWQTDPFSLGAYAYSTVQTGEAKKHINEPIENTIFFAGEALFEGSEMGTVEGALASGKSVARRIKEGGQT